MNFNIPQRQFTREEINRWYLRWQQLRNEHGENAPNVPEFVYFTRILQIAARQQQDLQQRQRQQQQQQEQQTQTQQKVPSQTELFVQQQGQYAQYQNANGSQEVAPKQNYIPQDQQQQQQFQRENSQDNNQAQMTSQTANNQLQQEDNTPKVDNVSIRSSNSNNKFGNIGDNVNSTNGTPAGMAATMFPPPAQANMGMLSGQFSGVTPSMQYQNNANMNMNMNEKMNVRPDINMATSVSVGADMNTMPTNNFNSGFMQQQQQILQQQQQQHQVSNMSRSSANHTPSTVPSQRPQASPSSGANKSPASASAQHQQQQPQPQHNNIFTPEQSLLLKAQITALKCLVNRQPVPIEFQSIIQQSINNPPDFRKMLISLSEYVRARQLAVQQLNQQQLQQQQQQQNQQAQQVQAQVQAVQMQAQQNAFNAGSETMSSGQVYPQMHQEKLPVEQQPQMQQQPQQLPKEAQHTPQPVSSVSSSVPTSITSPTVIPQSGGPKNARLDGIDEQMSHPTSRNSSNNESNGQIDSVSHTVSQTNVSPQQHEKSELTSPGKEQSPGIVPASTPKLEKLSSPQVQKPPGMAPPISLPDFQSLNPTAEKVVNYTDPSVMVDTFSPPTFAETPVEYCSLFRSQQNPKLYIYPGYLPDGLDVRLAVEAYQTLIGVDIDSSLDDCLADILEATENKDTALYEEALCDYTALELIPLQRALRGRILQFEWYQNSLVTSSYPNFLPKIRNVNFYDTLLTTELNQQHEKLEYEKQKTKEIGKLNMIAGVATAAHTARNEGRSRKMKFGHRLINLHVNLEKDEQKRQERKAKERLQALKANDEEAYIKLLDQTKDTRITQLLRQTNAFLNSLTRAVRDQQRYTKEMIDSHTKENSEGIKNISNDGRKAADSDDRAGKIIDSGDEDDDEDQQNTDYYNVAHRIKEEINQQPSILVGGTLKEYQLKGLQWMVSLFNNHLNGILADEMGLGKTIQTISLLTYLYEIKNVHGPFLVIVPLSTLSNWSNEFAKWAPTLRTISFKGSPNERKAKQAQIKSGDFDVVLTTFEYIIKERAVLSKIKWVHMIIDEGHRMKNTQSKLSLTLNTYYHSDYRLILTGTPLQNNLPELWALLNFVLPKIFNSVKSFDEWFNTPFANTGGQDKIELSEEETLLIIRRLHKVLRPFLLRRLKKDVESELPDKIEKVIKCKMSALQEVLYQQMLKHRRLYIGDTQNKKMVGLRGFNNQLMQLKKICNHPFVFEEVEDQINPTRETNVSIWRVAGKFELLERVLPKLKATGHRVLIFFQMTHIMDIMEDFLRFMGIKYLRLDGHTKSDERSQLLKLFNNPDSEYFCFILSTRAGGLGLNLQTADTVIIFDTDWNPHQDQQAQDRAHRIGQKNEVRILRLITQHSVEEAILERAHKKLDIDGKVIQAGKFDNKSTAEEQEALLRSLIDAEEERRRRREEGIDDNEELGDNELNEILARSDSEFSIFARLDTERNARDEKLGIKARLLTMSELPEIYTHEIPTDMELEELERAEAAKNSGRGTRERKHMSYVDDLPEDQWLKQFEISDDNDDDDNENNDDNKSTGDAINSDRPSESADITDPVELPDSEIIGDTRKRKAPRPRGRPKKVRFENSTTPSPADVPNGGHEADMQYADNESLTLFKHTAGKTSVKSARTAARGRPRTKGQNKRKVTGRGRGRPPKSKNGLEYLRHPETATESIETRRKVAIQAREMYTYIRDYKNDVGRTLSDIFVLRPSRLVYPDYYLLIKYPVALENIEVHIETLAYNTLLECLEDFHLIFANARIYNTEGSVIYLDSLELEQKAIDKYNELTGNTQPVDFTEFDKQYATSPLVIAAYPVGLDGREESDGTPECSDMPSTAGD